MTAPLGILHLFLVSANAIVAFSLLVYVLTHTRLNATTISFAVVAVLVTAMWVGEAGHVSVRALTADGWREATFWLGVQCLGLALLPPAYLHFSDTLLRSTGSLSTGRRVVVSAAYVVGAIWFILMIATDDVIGPPVLVGWGSHYRPGPLYPLFAVYFIVLTVWSLYNFFVARHRCLTASLRRRMGYLAYTFALPALGSIPYLLIALLLDSLPEVVLVLFAIAGSIGVSVMVVILAYVVSYQGVLLPDRVVKQSLISYLLRGPFLGVAVTFLIIVIPRLGKVLAIFSDRFLVFAVVFIIVVLQALLDRVRPFIDRLISQDEEILWLEELNQRLLTSADLNELLSNTVIAVCEVLRVPSGFVIAADRRTGEYRPQAVVGAVSKARAFLDSTDVRALAEAAVSRRQEQNGAVSSPYLEAQGYWLFPLDAEAEEAVGFLAAERPAGRQDLTAEEQEIVQVLVDRAGQAMADLNLQRSILATLRGVAPEIEQVQQWGSQLRYANPSALAQLEGTPDYSPEFQRAVRDALAHYWGGPKLTANLLLDLEVVKAALPEHGGNPSQALRTILRQSVEALRPPDDRDPMANEWVLYNILRLRFLQGKRVKEIVQELAMSESDFYRKERAAIREVARAVARMEKAHLAARR